MKKFVLALAALLLTASAHAQVSGAGQVGCNAAPVTGTAWSSATSLNTTQILAANVAGDEVLVTLDQGTTLTAGAVSFLGDPGDGNFVTLNAWQVIDPTTAPFATISLPYTLAASTNKQFMVLMSGYYRLELKLTTAITGTGSITPYTTIVCYPQQLAYQASNANFNASVTFPAAQAVNNTQQGTASQNVAQFGGNAVATGTGASGTGIPRVTVSNDSSLAANQSVNVNQIGGTSLAAADPCQANTRSTANISLTAGGQLIAGTSGKQTYICSMDIVTATAQNIALVEGTGTTCATGIAGMAGGTTAATGWNFAANDGLVKGVGSNWVFKTATLADNVCLLLSSTGQTSGSIQYVQQ